MCYPYTSQLRNQDNMHKTKITTKLTDKIDKLNATEFI